MQVTGNDREKEIIGIVLTLVCALIDAFFSLLYAKKIGHVNIYAVVLINFIFGVGTFSLASFSLKFLSLSIAKFWCYFALALPF
jgi:hypothetical protein